MSSDEDQEDVMIIEDGVDNKQANNSDNVENYQYKLVGVVVHMGTATAGHYLSYVNINRGQTKVKEESPEWLKNRE